MNIEFVYTNIPEYSGVLLYITSQLRNQVSKLTIITYNTLHVQVAWTKFLKPDRKV